MSRRGLIGGPAGVFRMAKAGFDAATASGNDLVFSEAFRTAHILARGSAFFIDLPNTGADSLGRVRRVSHADYGFVPLVLLRPFGTNGDFDVGYIYDQAATYFDIYCRGTDTSVSPTFYYTILSVEL